MRLNDAVWGALLLLFSVVLLVHVQSFPKIPGQQVGPALFPGFLAVGLAVCGALLIVKGLATRRAWGERAEWIAFAGWTRSRRLARSFAAVLGVNLFYVLLVDQVGFILTGTIYLALLFIVFGVRKRIVLPLALAMALGIHYAFYKLLKVPLPWGLLNGVAW